MNSDQTQFHLKLQRLLLAVGGAFLAITLALVYWGAVRSESLAARGDNPRLVEAALRVARGRILDYEDQVLAYTEVVNQRALRIYPKANIGPAVGYYSFRHGAAGAEEAYDAHLQGLPETGWAKFERELLNRPLQGQDVRLTLIADWQQFAAALLAEQTGAILMLTLPDGAIRIMTSWPSYDPSRLDADFEQLVADERAPLLNRVAQGQYQPGLALQPFLLAAALDEGLITLDQVVAEANRPLLVNGHTVNCLTAGAPEEMSWRESLQQVCPAPLLELAGIWGVAGLTAAFDNFGLGSAPDLRLATAVPPATPVLDPFNGVLGQDSLTISPLQLGLALTALANDGDLLQPQLTAALQDSEGRWQPQPPKPPLGQPVSQATARAILQSFNQHENILEHTAVALAGPDGSSHTWYMGLAPANAPRYLVVVVLEQTDNPTAARLIGRTLLSR